MQRPATYLLAVALASVVGCDSGTEPSVSVFEIIIGQGTAANEHDIVTINWIGMLDGGHVFDSSDEHGPLTFELETGVIQNLPENPRVIEGLVLGVRGMRVGGVRRITIPPELAYGRSGVQGRIPENATLIFQVELLSIRQL